MIGVSTLVGLSAAFCTTVSYIPQVVKCWKTRETGDLSLKMLLALGVGLTLWITYGVINSDWLIVGANSMSLLLLGNVLAFKVAETPAVVTWLTRVV